MILKGEKSCLPKMVKYFKSNIRFNGLKAVENKKKFF